jgi:hypothetical protein
LISSDEPKLCDGDGGAGSGCSCDCGDHAMTLDCWFVAEPNSQLFVDPSSERQPAALK